MGIMAKDSGSGDFTPVDQGMHHGVCVGVYDLGSQWNDKWAKSTHKVLIMWELPEVRINVGEGDEMKNIPRNISKQYTLSLHEKAILRKDLESWRGKAFSSEELRGFDITKLLGVNCQLQVLHNVRDGKTYQNIATIVPLGKGLQKLEPEGPLFKFSIEDGDEIPEGTPEWIKNIILKAEEITGAYQGYEPPPPDDDDSDPIPF